MHAKTKTFQRFKRPACRRRKNNLELNIKKIKTKDKYKDKYKLNNYSVADLECFHEIFLL